MQKAPPVCLEEHRKIMPQEQNQSKQNVNMVLVIPLLFFDYIIVVSKNLQAASRCKTIEGKTSVKISKQNSQ